MPIWQLDKILQREKIIYQIHTCRIPKDVLKRSWSNSWENEYFITDLDQLEIIGSKTYNGQELVNLYCRWRQKNSEAYDLRTNPEQTHRQCGSTILPKIVE